MRVRFDWDSAKAESNRRKHGISFATAVRAFGDPFALTTASGVEDGEMRWQTLGLVEGHVLLLVVHIVSEEDPDKGEIEIIRIISARRADRSERRRYEEEPR
jgi:uncharacterized protein